MSTGEDVFYKICFDSLLEGICIANYEGDIVLNNSAFEDIFGYNKGELLHQKIDLLIPDTFKENHQNHFKSYFQLPQKFKKGRGREFLGLHKDGSFLDLEIGLNYFKYKGDIYAKALVSDISIRKKNELKIKEQNRNLEKEVKNRNNQLTSAVLELEKSNTKLKIEIEDRINAENRAKRAFEKEKELNMMQTKFMSLASHEFKTPLSGILTSAGLIEKYNQFDSSQRIKSHVGTIKNLVNQLNTVLDDFLYLENTEAGDYSFQRTSFDFCEMLNKVVRDARAMLKEGQQIIMTNCDNSFEIVQDQKVLDIITRNVLYNAIKYSPKEKIIEVSVCITDRINILIKDQGIGIPKEAQKHIFERFYRAKNALTVQGTGIGLNIVKNHLERLKGSIEIISNENQGTEVIMKIPLFKESLIDSYEDGIKGKRITKEVR